MSNIYAYGKDKSIDLHDKKIPLARRITFGLIYLGKVTEFDFDASHREVEFAMNAIEVDLDAFDEWAKRKGEKLKRRYQVKKQYIH